MNTRGIDRSKFAGCALGCALLMFGISACESMNGKAPPASAVGSKIRPSTGSQISPEEGRQNQRDLADKARTQWRSQSFEAFKAQTYKEPFAGGKFIVNGDTPIANEKLLREFFDSEVQSATPKPARPMLAVGTTNPEELAVAVTSNGMDAIWNSSQRRSLSYCVSNSFGARYAQMVTSMKAAAEAWMAVADVKLNHSASLDSNCDASTQAVVFDVRPVNVNGRYLARAFFPNEPRQDRNVLVDASAFELGAGNLTLEGILRHELGHALGFRHEHTRPEAGTCFEDNDWRPLTDYDTFSVMHYPQCNGGGDWSLVLTAADKAGAACLYGVAPGATVDTSFCLRPAGPSPSGPQTYTQTYSDQQVSRNGEKPYGPFQVTAGTKFDAQMLGNGASAGDPDLYVRFGSAPTLRQFACRPYASNANESCSLDVPSNANQAFIMVRGYSAGAYHLIVTGVSSAQ